MSGADLWDLFAKIAYHYPSFVRKNENADEKHAEWLKIMKDVDFALAVANLERYASVAAHEYAPHAGALANKSEMIESNYVPTAEETRLMLDEQEKMLITAETIPDSARERMRRIREGSYVPTIEERNLMLATEEKVKQLARKSI